MPKLYDYQKAIRDLILSSVIVSIKRLYGSNSQKTKIQNPSPSTR